jgi:alkanesulfonate monooxygenase SsuD/methylene tetrahydromethanopterin reductase-like flavin-dependent oxidoreductase (luciferase family)
MSSPGRIGWNAATTSALMLQQNFGREIDDDAKRGTLGPT